MAEQTPRAGGATSGALSPRVVLGVFAAIVIATLLLSSDESERRGDPRLSSRSASSQGARGLADMLGRLGWRVERRTDAYAGPLGVAPESSVVHAVLAPPTPLRGSEIGALLAAVRRGAGLLVVLPERSALADSLGYSTSVSAGRLAPAAADTAGCPAEPWGGEGAINWPDGDVHTLYLQPDSNRRRSTVVEFASADRQFSPKGLVNHFPAAVGVSLGRGRVVVVADPDLLRNDVLRVCRWGAGVAAARMADWLADAAGARRVVFDEFHQDDAAQPHPERVVARALGTTRLGRTTLQLALAALLLLGAVGARALPPAARPRVMRRSPLEHVDALARAYAQVNATRVVARRLVRGLRRRHGRGAWRSADGRGDEAFLRVAAARRPGVADAVDRLLGATERPAPSAAAVAADAATIDQALTPGSSVP